MFIEGIDEKAQFRIGAIMYICISKRADIGGEEPNDAKKELCLECGGSLQNGEVIYGSGN